MKIIIAGDFNSFQEENNPNIETFTNVQLIDVTKEYELADGKFPEEQFI